MQGLELERVQELGEPGETRWGRLRGGALQWGTVHSSGGSYPWKSQHPPHMDEPE